MAGLKLWRIMIMSVVMLFLFSRVYRHRDKPESKLINSQILARSGVFAGISIILYIVPFFNLKLPFFPSFLSIHFDEVPILIAGFAYGPFSAFLIILIKTFVKLPMTSTLGVGELADLIYSCGFVLPASFLYQKKRTLKTALSGLVIGIIFQLIISGFFTTFVMLDFYIAIMGMKKESLLALCQLANPRVTSLRWPYFWFVSIPFNLLKDLAVGTITFLLYKRLHRLIDRIGSIKKLDDEA